MNKTQINHYSKLVKFLGATLGPDYEIALHDVTPKVQQIVAIANNHISGRSVGAPLTDFALKMIQDRAYEQEDFKLNYRGMSKDNKTLRSSTMFIKDETGKLTGMLCINFDGGKYARLSNDILQLCQPNEFIEANFSALPQEEPEGTAVENFADTIHDVTQAAIYSLLDEQNIPVERLTQEEKLRIVDTLNQKGVFMLKGAVSQVAKQLCCSEASIYRYLSKLNRDGE